MRIFITGATGFVGSAVTRDLIDGGHHVVGLARTEAAVSVLAALGAEAHRGDLKDLQSLHDGASSADAVIHAAFEHDFSRLPEACETDRRAIEALGGALEGSGRPLIVTAGLPLVRGRAATEADVQPAGGQGIPRVSEQTALAMLDRGVGATVIRMPQVHDADKQGFGSYMLAHAREKGLSAYVGDGLNRWPAVHRLDAARLYRAVLESGSSGGTWHAVAEEGVSVRAIAEAIGRGLGVPVVSLTPDQSALHFGWLDRIVGMDLPASSRLTRERRGWVPRARTAFISDIEQASARKG